jgi:hypothetical protein
MNRVPWPALSRSTDVTTVSIEARCHMNFIKEHAVELVALLVVLAVVGLFYYIFKDLFASAFSGDMAAMRGQSNGFIADADAGRYQEAYTRMGDRYRAQISFDRFRDQVSANPHLKAVYEVQFRKFEQLEGSAKVISIIKSDAGEVTGVFSFSRRGDSWSLVGLEVGGIPAVPVYGSP